MFSFYVFISKTIKIVNNTYFLETDVNCMNEKRCSISFPAEKKA